MEKVTRGKDLPSVALDQVERDGSRKRGRRIDVGPEISGAELEDQPHPKGQVQQMPGAGREHWTRVRAGNHGQPTMNRPPRRLPHPYTRPGW